jgi:hypothetical protein
MTQNRRLAVRIAVVVILVVMWGCYLTGMFARMRFEARAKKINCVNNLQQTGLVLRQWALDHGDKFPFQVSTNAGGTAEHCAATADGFEVDAPRHLQALSNELGTTMILVCPQDRSKTPASDFAHLSVSNVTYLLRASPGLSPSSPADILMFCPVDGNALCCDGSVIKWHGAKP